MDIPDAQSRWRCTSCGNLTRFDVERTVRSREYWHVDLAGEPVIDEATVLNEKIEAVTCRWCSARDSIVTIPRAPQ